VPSKGYTPGYTALRIATQTGNEATIALLRVALAHEEEAKQAKKAGQHDEL